MGDPFTTVTVPLHAECFDAFARAGWPVLDPEKRLQRLGGVRILPAAFGRVPGR
jgi:hypothetical protein